jgi:hypothetical protein
VRVPVWWCGLGVDPVRKVEETMTDEYKPYLKEETYKVALSKDEALLIQRIREVPYGFVTAHLVAYKIVRTEVNSSELTKDRKKETVTIALEVISG